MLTKLLRSTACAATKANGVRALEATKAIAARSMSVRVACDGNEAAATVDILGIAADDTEKLPYNGMYEIIDNYFKNGKVAAYVLGGLFTIWNDGRGAVFATAADGSSVLNAAPGTPLYIGADGALTKKADTTATNVGAIVVGSVIRAPKDADGTLFFKAKGL